MQVSEDQDAIADFDDARSVVQDMDQNGKMQSRRAPPTSTSLRETARDSLSAPARIVRGRRELLQDSLDTTNLSVENEQRNPADSVEDFTAEPLSHRVPLAKGLVKLVAASRPLQDVQVDAGNEDAGDENAAASNSLAARKSAPMLFMLTPFLKDHSVDSSDQLPALERSSSNPLRNIRAPVQDLMHGLKRSRSFSAHEAFMRHMLHSEGDTAHPQALNHSNQHAVIGSSKSDSQIDAKYIAENLASDAPFSQAGGHQGAFRHDGSMLVKTVDQREREFYDNAKYRNTWPTAFLPAYYGACGKNNDSIRIENLTFGMKYPCVLDLKLGTSSVEDAEASRMKKIRMKSLDRVTKTKAVGVRLEGMSVHRAMARSLITASKNQSHIISAALISLYDVLLFFLTDESGVRTDIALRFKNILQGILYYFENENDQYLFIGSSILLVYDNDNREPYSRWARAITKATKLGPQDVTGLTSRTRVEVRMIDFAHVGPIPDGQKRDDGYITGLRSIINALESICIGSVQAMFTFVSAAMEAAEALEPSGTTFQDGDELQQSSSTGYSSSAANHARMMSEASATGDAGVGSERFGIAEGNSRVSYSERRHRRLDSLRRVRRQRGSVDVDDDGHLGTGSAAPGSRDRFAASDTLKNVPFTFATLFRRLQAVASSQNDDTASR